MAQKITMRPAMEQLRQLESPRLVLDIPKYEDLKIKIEEMLDSGLVPRGYKKALVGSFYTALDDNDEEWFKKKLKEKQTSIRNIVRAILQNFDLSFEYGVSEKETEAFREVLSSFYRNFFTTVPESVAPILNWNNKDYPSSTRPQSDLGVEISIVNLPSCFAQRAVLAWGCLGHEATGGDILRAYPRALKELQHQFQFKLNKNNLIHLAPYWIEWFEESTADVLNVLNLGPAGAFSLIGFLRAQEDNLSFRLSSKGHVHDKFPIDLIRGFLVAYTLEIMKSKEQTIPYVDTIREEVQKDAEGISHIEWDIIVLGQKADLPELLTTFYEKAQQKMPAYRDVVQHARQLCESPRWRDEFVKFLSKRQNDESDQTSERVIKSHPLEDFKRSARLFVEMIVNFKLSPLGQKSFSDLRLWSARDEEISHVFRILIKLPSKLDPVATYKEGFFAAHVISAAVMESILEPIEVEKLQGIFERMVEILQTMHKTNPAWAVTKKNSESAESTEDFFEESAS